MKALLIVSAGGGSRTHTARRQRILSPLRLTSSATPARVAPSAEASHRLSGLEPRRLRSGLHGLHGEALGPVVAIVLDELVECVLIEARAGREVRPCGQRDLVLRAPASAQRDAVPIPARVPGRGSPRRSPQAPGRRTGRRFRRARGCERPGSPRLAPRRCSRSRDRECGARSLPGTSCTRNPLELRSCAGSLCGECLGRTPAPLRWRRYRRLRCRASVTPSTMATTTDDEPDGERSARTRSAAVESLLTRARLQRRGSLRSLGGPLRRHVTLGRPGTCRGGGGVRLFFLATS